MLPIIISVLTNHLLRFSNITLQQSLAYLSNQINFILIRYS